MSLYILWENWLVNKLNEPQAVQLDILKEFSRVVERERLTWFAMFGTLLGASRHGGFIPWDNDIDVVMPRKDYNRLLTGPEVFHEPYFLQTTINDPVAAPRFMRLRRSDTAYIKNFPSSFIRGGHMGIYIDVIPLDIVPDIVAAGRIQNAAHIIHNQMLGSAAFDEGGAGMSDFIEAYCYKKAGLPGHYGIFADCYEKMCSSFSSGHYYAMPVLYGTRGITIYDREWFKESVYMEFEGFKIPVPSGWKEALIASYPEGLYERERRYIPVGPADEDIIIDTRRSYREYTRRFTDALIGTADKKIFFFGAGDSLRVWLERYGEGLNVICTFDNARSKWGAAAYGVPVRSPAELPKLLDADSRLIVTSIYYKEISKQLDDMGIKDYFIFIDGWDYRKGLD